MLRLALLLWVACGHADPPSTIYPMCNAENDFEIAWIKSMYSMGHANVPSVDSRYNVAGCKDFLISSKQFDMFWNSNDKAECGLTVVGVSALTWIFPGASTAIPLCRGLINRDTEACRTVLQTDFNARNGLNLEMSWPTTGLPFVYQINQATSGPSVQNLFIDQTTGQNHQYTPYGLGKSTHWAQVSIDTIAMNADIDPIYQLPVELSKSPVRFSSQGFLGLGNLSFTKHANLAMKQNASQAWGVTTNGCMPPVFTIRVSFVSSSEVPNTQAQDTYGSMKSLFTGIPTADSMISINQGGKPVARRRLLAAKHSCYRRVVEVIEVGAQYTPASAYLCQMEFSTLSVRNSLLSPYTLSAASWQGTTATALVVAKLISNSKYAVLGSDSSRFIAISVSYAQQVVNCAVGTTQWKFDANSNVPGGCSRCDVSIKPNAISVKCGLSDATDCCYACKARFMLVLGTCLQWCPRTQAYTLPGVPACQRCLKGTVQNISSGTQCVACSLLPGNGLNSVAIPTTGMCTRCGMLQYADPISGFTSCVSCAAFQYVPEGTASCRSCDYGKVLSSGPTGVYSCTACSPGYYQHGNECFPCMPQSIAPLPGSNACALCKPGLHTVGMNRTACVACPTLNGSYSTLVAYSRQDGSACALECAAGAYKKTSVYTPGKLLMRIV